MVHSVYTHNYYLFVNLLLDRKFIALTSTVSYRIGIRYIKLINGAFNLNYSKLFHLFVAIVAHDCRKSMTIHAYFYCHFSMLILCQFVQWTLENKVFNDRFSFLMTKIKKNTWTYLSPGICSKFFEQLVRCSVKFS